MTCQILGTDIVDEEIRGCEGEDTNHERITTEIDGAMLVIVATIICSTVVTTLIMISAIVCICMKCRNTEDSESYNTSQYTEETEEYCYTIPTQQQEDYVLLPSQYTLHYQSSLNNNKGAFKYYISMFSQILDPPPPPKMLILYRQYKHFWSDPLPPTPPKRAYIILERSLNLVGFDTIRERSSII